MFIFMFKKLVFLPFLAHSKWLKMLLINLTSSNLFFFYSFIEKIYLYHPEREREREKSAPWKALTSPIHVLKKSTLAICLQVCQMKADFRPLQKQLH